ncbi:hypothetical protein INS49_004975 [Diaporthe citri]|uniref:uncharacterized protein n=1 Tax=Diaporthe citri TaxID=83186 RepID=UPI001C7E48C5|nr:uncharacterized protein INS49_004975 [Diaporthe citri]KAG6354004.1 hypothetical protein INS49_004975 [Diaporthe citri]
MFGLIGRIIPTLSGAASYWPAGLTSIIPNPLGMLGRQPAATNDDVPRPKPEAGNTTGSANAAPFANATRYARESGPTVASLGRRATGLASRPIVNVMNRMGDDEWNARTDAKLLAQEGPSMARMLSKRTPIVTPQPVQEPAVIRSLPVAKQPDTPAQPAEEHTDLKRWKEDEEKNLLKEELKRAAEEIKRIAENHKAVVKRISELEQQEKQRSEDVRKAYLARIAEVDQRVAKKADKEQVDQQGRDVASLCPLIGKVMEDALSLQTRFDGLSEKVDLVEGSQGAMKTAIDANTRADLELRGRVHVLENPLPVEQVNIADLGAAATTTPASEQPQAKTGGCDPKEVSDLTAKTDGHDQRIERLETAMGDVVPKMENASPWFDWAGSELETHAHYFEEHKDIPEKVKEIEAAHERQRQILDEALAKQKESFEEQLRQQKEASDKEKQDLQEAMKEQMRLSEASIRKEYDERIASKDKEFAERFAKADAAKKEQDERHSQLEDVVNGMFAMMQGQNPTQQFPAPVQGQQQQPQAPQPQPTPAPQGNGPWTVTPTPPNQDPQPVPRPDVNMGGIAELDDEMKDADPEPQQQPFSQPPRQPSQPNFAMQDDTPMTSGEPVIPNNNGNLGFGSKPQPMGSNQPFAGTGPAQPPFQAPTPTAAPVATGTGSSHFGSSAGGPMIPTGQQGLPNPTATPAKAPAPSKFGFGGPPPAVNKPQINWSASAGSLNFDPPAGMDIDDDDVKPSAPKPKQPLVNAPPATPWTGQPAANNAPSANAGGSDTVMTNGPSTPANPASTKPFAPKPAKKKADPMVQRKPGATPSKPTETTNKTQTTKTKMASLAEKKRAAFAANYGSTPAPKTIVEKTALPSEEPSESNIPGLNGAVNTSPFALKPKAPAPAPKPVAPTSPMYNPTSPASNHAASAPKLTTSPLANPAATSDTIESATTTNVFSKEVEKPVEQPSEDNGNSAPEQAKGEAGGNADDIQMSGDETKPEATEPLKYETDVNPRKHSADVQITPHDAGKIHRRESQEDAKARKPEDGAKAPQGESHDDSMDDKQESQVNDAMETDRPMAKPKGKASKLTAAQIKRQKDDFNEQSAWDEMDKAFEHKNAQALKAAEATADDEVDYADPNDINDEDVHITTMVPPTPSMRPTQYTVNFFHDWKAHYLSDNNLTIQAAVLGTVRSDEVAHFIKIVREQDVARNLDFLFEQAKIPNGKRAYSKSEMVRLLSAFREEVFIQAIIIMDLDDLDRGFKQTRGMFMVDMANWFQHHKPDAA